MRRWSVTLCSLLFVAAFAATSFVAGAGSAYASEPTGQCPLAAGGSAAPESESSAQADAAALLSELPLPPGSGGSSTDPAEAASLLAGPGSGPPATPNVVDDHAWWLVPGTPSEALAYICAHLPPGTTRSSSGGGLSGPNIPENTTSGFILPGGAGTLVVWAVRLANGSTALRVDAQVVWITPRPTSQTIPAGARLLQIAVNGSIPSGIDPLRSSVLDSLPARVESSEQIEATVAVLNHLRTAQPGVRSCPFDRGTSIELSFFTAPESPPLAAAEIAAEGCGGVHLTIGGISQGRLESGWEAIEEIAKALGVTAERMPVGPLPRVSGLRIAPSKFRARGGDVVTVGAPTGAQLTFDLSVPAQVSLAISRLASLRHHTHGCNANARTRRCARVVSVGKPTLRDALAGGDSIEVSGELEGRTLLPGRYLAVLTARNSSGVSRPASVAFEITR